MAYLDIELKRDRPNEALILLRKAVELRNDIRIAYLDMGAILAQQNHHQDAIAALRRTRDPDPTQTDVHFRLGRLYQAKGNRVAAQKEFAKLHQLHQKADEDIAAKMSGSPTSSHQ